MNKKFVFKEDVGFQIRIIGIIGCVLGFGLLITTQFIDSLNNNSAFVFIVLGLFLFFWGKRKNIEKEIIVVDEKMIAVVKENQNGVYLKKQIDCEDLLSIERKKSFDEQGNSVYDMLCFNLKDESEICLFYSHFTKPLYVCLNQFSIAKSIRMIGFSTPDVEYNDFENRENLYGQIKSNSK